MGRPSSVSFDVSVGEFETSLAFSLESAARWFQDLSFRNAEARARDEDPSLRLCRSVRVQCPACRAPIFFLTAVERGGGLVRACRRCRSEFSVES